VRAGMGGEALGFWVRRRRRVAICDGGEHVDNVGCCGEGGGLDENVNEVEVLVEQLEDETGAKDDQVKLLRHEGYVGGLAAARLLAQVHRDDEHAEEAHELGEEGDDEQHVLVEDVDDGVHEEQNEGQAGEAQLEAIGALQQLLNAAADGLGLRA